MPTDINLGNFQINDDHASPSGFADSLGNVFPVGLITWPLPDDCDRITIDLNEKNVLAPTMLGIRLMTQPGMAFKAIEAYRSDGDVTKIESEDGRMTVAVIIEVDALEATTLFFIKGNALGERADVYHLKAADLRAFVGSIITFNWQRDRC